MKNPVLTIEESFSLTLSFICVGNPGNQWYNILDI